MCPSKLCTLAQLRGRRAPRRATSRNFPTAPWPLTGKNHLRVANWKLTGRCLPSRPHRPAGAQGGTPLNITENWAASATLSKFQRKAWGFLSVLARRPHPPGGSYWRAEFWGNESSPSCDFKAGLRLPLSESGRRAHHCRHIRQANSYLRRSSDDCGCPGATCRRSC